MSVRIEGGFVHLEGRCLAEDAEHLLRALQDTPHLVVDIAGAQRVHTAVLQILLALRPALRGRPMEGILSREIVLSLISHGDTAGKNF